MTSNNMDLSVWGAGEIKLAFWDSEHGEDRIFALTHDGMALEEVTEGDNETKRSVDLVQELRALALKFNEKARQEIRDVMAL